MATTTTNFGWDIPQSTDLVKDGATAIAALGQDIDTSMVDLKGGTTGQVLSKASNTDMDFTWVAQDDSNAIQNSIVDAKGDLITATANDTPARLAVGTNGQMLIADSTQSSGLLWTNQISAAGKNGVINGAFDFWQRGTTSTSTGYYTADRWVQTRGAATASWSQVSSSLPTGFRYAMKVQRTAGQTSTDGIAISQAFETVNSIPFAGQVVTLSFYAKAGANFSATGSKMPLRLYTGTGTDQGAGVFGTWTGYAEPIAQDATLTTSWQRFSFTGTIASTATQIGMVFYLNGTGTAGADDSFSITGVQLEIASVATPFSRAGGTIQGELAACQRYYVRYSSDGSTNFDLIGPYGAAATTTLAYFPFVNPTMRTVPSAVDYANLRLSDNAGGNPSISNITILANSNPTTATLEVTTSGATAFRPYMLQANNNATAYIGLSAEL